MWHHAYVSIDEDGTGMLFVDGEQQQLVTAVDEYDLLKDFSEPLGDTFTTEMYPTRCVADEVATKKRKLLQVPSPDLWVTQSQSNFENVDDGFVGEDHVLTPSNVSDPELCCNFRIGQRCGGLQTDGRDDENEAKPFYGMIDEVAVYNRPLDQSDVRGVMWAMAANRKVHALAAPAGKQLDYTAGRVFYARFNRPCSEAPVSTPSPPPPAPPSPPPPPSGRRLLWDDAAPVVTSAVSSSSSARSLSRRTLLQADSTYPLAYAEERDVGRLEDSAGRTAGTASAGAQTVSDLYDDTIYVTDYPHNAKYAYHGVPWAPPQVRVGSVSLPLTTFRCLDPPPPLLDSFHSLTPTPPLSAERPPR